MTEDMPAPGGSIKPVRMGGAVDHIAAATAVIVIALGVVQLVAPLVATPFTAIENGAAAHVLAVQWIVFGAILALGGILRIRVVTIFAAEFLLVAGLIGVVVMMLQQHDPIPLAVQGAVALIGLLNSGIARLTDKAELKREIRLVRRIDRAVEQRDCKADGQGGAQTRDPPDESRRNRRGGSRLQRYRA